MACEEGAMGRGGKKKRERSQAHSTGRESKDKEIQKEKRGKRET